MNDKRQNDAGDEWDAAVERLRKSRDEMIAEKASDGDADGKFWAKQEAEYDVLEGLGKAMDHNGDIFDACDEPGWSVVRQIMLATWGDCSNSDLGYILFSEMFGNDNKNPSVHYLGAFIKGALEVFDEVNRRLDQ